MAQWARVDFNIGKELTLRVDQVLALKRRDTDEAKRIHDERILCLKRAVEALEECPMCQHDPTADDAPKEEAT